MKTSLLGSIACSGVALLGVSILGFNASAPPSMVSDGRLMTGVSGPSSERTVTMGHLQQDGDIATMPNPDLPQPGVVDPSWNQEEEVNQPLDLVSNLVDGEPPMEPIKDTATFVFGLDEGVLGGGQLFGTMDKVGVHTSVDTAYSNIAGELAHMGAAKAAREKFLATEGVDLSNPNRRWLVKIWEVAAVGQELRYVVSAKVGQDPTTSSQASNLNDATIVHELWTKHADGSNPTLLRRSLRWDTPDAD